METQKKSWKQRVKEYDGLPVDWHSNMAHFLLGVLMGIALSILAAIIIHSLNHRNPSDNTNRIEFCSDEMGSKC